MTDSIHHDGDEGFHEIQLSGKQLVFAFMATTVVAVAIFLTGVQVGRAARPDRATDALDASAAATPAAATSVPSQTAPPVGTPPADPPAPASEGTDDLSYAKRLQGNPPVDKLKAPPDGAGSPNSAAPLVRTPLVEKAAPPKAAPPKPAPEKPAAKPVPTAPAPAPAPAAAAGQPGKWIVQVSALQDRGAAASLAHRLASKGYPAFVQDPAAGSPVIYRVQLGGYSDRSQAEQASKRLEKEEQTKSIIRTR